MKRLLPILLCLLALAVSRLHGQDHTVTFSAQPADGGIVKATYAEGFKNVVITSGAKVPAGKYATSRVEVNEGYEFEKFTVNGLDAPEDFTNPGQYATELSEDLNVITTFKALAPAKKYAVIFTAEPAEYGMLIATRYDRDSEKDIPFNSDDEIEDGIWTTLNARPGTNYKAEKWLVNGTAIEMPSNPNKHEIELKETLDVKVVFTTKPNEVTLKYNVAAEPAEAGQIVVAVIPKGGGDAAPVESGKKATRGSSVTFIAKSAAGYEAEKWLVSGTKDKKAGRSTILVITLDEDTEVQLVFQKEAKKCIINPSVTPVEGGTTKATGYVNDVFKTIADGEVAPENSYLDFEATANEDYEFERRTYNGAEKKNLPGEPNKPSFAQIANNTDIVAHFKKAASKIKITYSAGEYGRFTKVKVQKDGERDATIESGAEVDRGSYIVLPVEPDRSYIVDKRSVNGDEVHSKEVNSYDAIFEETSEVKVTFGRPELTIADAEGGKIVAKVGDKEVSNGVDVALGENVSIEAIPDAGYELTALTASDKDILAAESFKMKGDMRVAVIFTKRANVANYKVTLKSSEHGTISIKEKFNFSAVLEGTKPTVVAKGANDKCELTKLTVNGVDIPKDKTFTVTKDTEIIAEFVDRTGIDAVTADAFVIYPNPTNESAAIAGLALEAAVILYTLDGQLITHLAADRSGHLQTDLTALSDGTYLVVTEGATQRLVVKH